MDEFEGAITGILDGHVVGWAWRPTAPETKVSLEIWLGAHRLGQCDAALFDTELQAKGIGDGHHAFRYRPTSVPEVDFPATIFGCVVDSDHYLGGSLLISSAQELIKRFAVHRAAEAGSPATVNDTVAAAAPPQRPRPVEAAPPPQVPPPRGPSPVPPPDQAAAGVEILTAQLTLLRDMIGQSLIERVEAQLTILRDEFDREMQLVRRDLAALASRLPRGGDLRETAPTGSPAPAVSLEYTQPDAPIAPAPSETIEQNLPAVQPPVQQDRIRETPPVPSERHEPPREAAAPPLKYQRFAPVAAQRPSAPPLPGRGPRRRP